jgi:threonine dehydrogenase-like Zn-dependent dehydrogenase
MGGRLVVAGYHQDGPRQVNMQDWNWKGIDVVNAHERDPAIHRQGLREAVEAVASGRIDLAPLLTHVYPLDRLGEAITATRDKPQGFVKALVTYA